MYLYKMTVTRVVDGDTIEGIVDLGFNVSTTLRFRLLDIDTPETFRPRNELEKEHGKRATARVEELILGKTVLVRSHKTGKYGRWLAEIFVNDADYDAGRQLADILIEEGLAKKESY